jgi:serralysin
VTDDSDDVSDRAVILHEFGHMLGLGHEQSHPDQDIRWDREKALRYYMQTQGWSAQMVVDNVFVVFERKASSRGPPTTARASCSTRSRPS